MKADKILAKADPYLKIIVVLGTAIYLWEVSSGGKDSSQTHPFFLWAERFVASIFTIEYILRWLDDVQDNRKWHYPHSPLGIIDLVSILPFWLGFIVPVDWLHLIRTFRIFRLLKFFRYNRSLQLVALGF